MILQDKFQQFLREVYPRGKPTGDQYIQLENAFFGGAIVATNALSEGCDLGDDFFEHLMKAQLRSSRMDNRFLNERGGE